MSFLKDGYEIVDLKDGTGVAYQRVFQHRVQLWRSLGELETYHQRIDERDHIAVQAAALEKSMKAPRQIIEWRIEYFHQLIGYDLHIQQKPFLRISRPGIAEDNIGFHRDTWYGDTPYEVSVWIPFTDTDEGNCLYVAPGSHLWSEKDYPTERFAVDVEKGSTKHDLGFIYSPPKRLKTPVEMKPLPVKVGQMIVFSLALLHGQEVNRSTRTRVSMDVRLCNSLAPVAMARSRNPNYYERLCMSPVTQAALRYAENQ